MSRSHPVDPSRGTQHDNVDAYRAGYLAARGGGGGGMPPRRGGCLLGLLLIPLALARHRPDRWRARAHARTAGGLPCLVVLLLAPLLPLVLLLVLARAVTGRHRHPDQRDRPDSHPDRLGAHHLTRAPFVGATIPAAQLSGRATDTTDGKEK